VAAQQQGGGAPMTGATTADTSNQNTPLPNSTSSVHTAEVTLQAPTPENPTGRGTDEYKARTWDALVKQRPMQDQEDRNINTPQVPEKPKPTRQINTPTPGLGDDDEDDDERDEDEE
jgi:hypothetical protein